MTTRRRPFAAVLGLLCALSILGAGVRSYAAPRASCGMACCQGKALATPQTARAAVKVSSCCNGAPAAPDRTPPQGGASLDPGVTTLPATTPVVLAPTASTRPCARPPAAPLYLRLRSLRL